MNTKIVAALLIGLAVGSAATLAVRKRAADSAPAAGTQAAGDMAEGDMDGMDMGAQDSSQAMSMTFGDMAASLSELNGDAFDRAFISEMIAHHQGALDMAKLAASRAKHPEVKGLAGDIVSAQASEIEEMRQWQSDWGY